MNILISGGTGFVGKRLTKSLVHKGNQVFILTRSPHQYASTKEVQYVCWDTLNEGKLPPIDAVVNLAGESLFGRWTSAKKEKILSSRIQATESILSFIKMTDQKPKVLINASAVGYYGTSYAETFKEGSTTPGSDFLANVVRRWEATASQAENLGVRTVFARFGIILGQEGSLPLMALPFRLFTGGKVGSGEQWMSWVHIDDVVGLVLFAIKQEQIHGPLNVTAPRPLQNKELSKRLAEALHRPYWLPAPSFALKLALGEMSTLVLDGQKVLPDVAEKNGYTFIYPDVEGAFKEIYSR
ncbi:TIGR01777 family oxidoreductase [Radiobacillus kanasensis]|uniref:TIGR01777 family oxidoreductase n=1 Tax=Radiobacillus kanasensis TaxID=2844358 RepID=UPI001E5E2353|nr:TIGR01777 family oxidoreductase [Radiobacillus kanasensis]UFU00062.1 TIGR01777 family oxidoreductase [Radiobacillus kanasensis]